MSICDFLCNYYDSDKFDFKKFKVLFSVSKQNDRIVIFKIDFSEFRRSIIRKYEFRVCKNVYTFYLSLWIDGFNVKHMATDKENSFVESAKNIAFSCNTERMYAYFYVFYNVHVQKHW